MTSDNENGWWPAEQKLQYRLCDLGGTLIDQELFLVDEYAPNNLPAIVELCAEQVTELQVVGDEWGDRHMEQLQKLSNLSSLRLSQCSRLTDEGLFHISKIESLQSLDLSGITVKDFTVVGFRRLARLPQLGLLRLPRAWPCAPAEDLTRSRTNAVLADIQAAMPNTIVKK